MKNKFYAIKTMRFSHQDAYVYAIEDNELISSEFVKAEDLKSYIKCLEDLGYARAYTKSEHESNIEEAQDAIRKAQYDYDIVAAETILDQKFGQLFN